MQPARYHTLADPSPEDGCSFPGSKSSFVCLPGTLLSQQSNTGQLWPEPLLAVQLPAESVDKGAAGPG